MNGDLIRRGRRVSFTFREARLPDGIPPPPMSSTSMTTPASSASSSADDEVKAKKTLEAYRSGAMDVKGLLSSEIEEEHVFKVYDEIAQHWHHTRGRRKVRLHFWWRYVFTAITICVCVVAVLLLYTSPPVNIYLKKCKLDCKLT